MAFSRNGARRIPRDSPEILFLSCAQERLRDPCSQHTECGERSSRHHEVEAASRRSRGVHPSSSEQRVFHTPLPKSKTASKYCMDFVLSAWSEPINSPFNFNLLAGPRPSMPVGFAPTVGIRSPVCFRNSAEKHMTWGGEVPLVGWSAVHIGTSGTQGRAVYDSYHDPAPS
ncbi:hypothetical protein BC628DRAFT_1401663 [Trametes gibbosa]|nr:hypothetical protein BC628DRAFT_1401663 [Trametes gibbosa]